MVSKVSSSALDIVFECIQNKQSFVLQGGAGSGKTESLKRVIQHISETNPTAKIACITHTNLAVDEIKSRLDNNEHTISTIHSFLNLLIKDYKKNIHQVIHKIFSIDTLEDEEGSHSTYKKTYKKYASMSFKVLRNSVPSVINKKTYDENPAQYNLELNEQIKELNQQIQSSIRQKDFKKIKYSDTAFSSFQNLTFGHDDLLIITVLLLKEFPLLSKIIQDKFDYIFIDEYQDTNKEIIELFLTKLAESNSLTVGLFGDSMQGIYEDSIGDVNEFIDSAVIRKIEKEDNYRCSQQVINFINNFRDDGLTQNVAFKTIDDRFETMDDRQGSVKLYYAIYDGDRTDGGTPKNKPEYLDFVKSVIQEVRNQNPNFKQLMLTNKSIAEECGFSKLYQVFNNRYIDVKDEIEKELSKLGLLDLTELCRAYKNKKYNFVISELKKSGFTIQNQESKQTINAILSKMVDSYSSMIDLLTEAHEKNIIQKSESYLTYLDRKNTFLAEKESDTQYQEFKNHYETDKNTFSKIKNYFSISEEEFKQLETDYKKEQFFIHLFSSSIPFKEVLRYVEYLNEELNYITMHKTKGSAIKNVMVVLENYFWNSYNFTRLFDPNEPCSDTKLRTQKLFYVACSRTEKDLICIKIIQESEKDNLLSHFENSEEIILPIV